MIRRVLIAAAAALSIAPSAWADGLKIESVTYVSVTGLWTKADTPPSSSLKDNGIGLGGVIGWRAHRYVGLEVGYEQWATSLDLGQGYSRDLTMRTFSGDLYGYYPIPRLGWLQPFITLGLGRSAAHARTAHEWDKPVLNADGTPKLDADKKATTEHLRDIAEPFSGNNVHLRLGGGIEWAMGRRFAGRFTARYQPYRIQDLDHGMTVSVSLLVKI